MRVTLYKCPNHLHCLTGYHGDDVEIHGDAPRICPECGSPLRPIPRAKSAVQGWLWNLLIFALLAIGLWLAWPSLRKLLHRLWHSPPVPAVTK